jgi:Tfp pilus assembly protein FimT
MTKIIKMKNKITSNRSGFTLIELFIVMGLIFLISLIVAPNISVWIANYKLKSAVMDLYTHMQYAKLTAVKENRDCSIIFTAQAYTVDGSRIVRLEDYAKEVKFKGPGGETITFTGNTLTFNSRGINKGVSGYAYLTRDKVAKNDMPSYYRVGSLTSGVVRMEKL